MTSYEELKLFLRENRTIKDLHHGHRILQQLESGPDAQAAKRVKVAILASYTSDFIVPLLKTELALSDLACEVYKPGFNQFRQDVLNRKSPFYAFTPQVTIVAFGLDDVIPDALSQFSILPEKERADLQGDILELVATLVGSYRNVTDKGTLFIQDFIPPWYMFDPLVRNERSIHSFVARLNAELRDRVKHLTNVHVLDYSRLVFAHGAQNWTDPRTYYTARIPVAQQYWIALSETYARYIRAALNLETK